MSLPYPFAFRLHPSLRVGPLAQLVEQLTLNQRVRSSSLRRPTIFSLSSAQLFDAFSAILKRENALSSVSLSAGITATIEQEIETGRLKGKISLNEMIDHSFINSMGKK